MKRSHPIPLAPAELTTMAATKERKREEQHGN